MFWGKIADPHILKVDEVLYDLQVRLQPSWVLDLDCKRLPRNAVDNTEWCSCLLSQEQM